MTTIPAVMSWSSIDASWCRRGGAGDRLPRAACEGYGAVYALRLDLVEAGQDRIELALVLGELDHRGKNAAFMAAGIRSPPSKRKTVAFLIASADFWLDGVGVRRDLGVGRHEAAAVGPDLLGFSGHEVLQQVLGGRLVREQPEQVATAGERARELGIDLRHDEEVEVAVRGSTLLLEEVELMKLAWWWKRQPGGSVNSSLPPPPKFVLLT